MSHPTKSKAPTTVLKPSKIPARSDAPSYGVEEKHGGGFVDGVQTASGCLR